MKELSIEEKARRYDEVIGRGKSLLSGNKVGNAWIYKLLPELEEPEDEKIRKELINGFNKLDKSAVWYNGITNGQILAWIEKQGEQKSTNEVEPKFHVGDWVVFNDKHESIYQVEKIEDGYYILRHTYGGTFRVCVLHDEGLRLWTINDAKDGDVLANKYGAIFINAGSSKVGGTLDFYYYLSVQSKFCIEKHKTGSWFYKDEIKPATKEQRDLLFQKMKESGYEWDAEKRELKKIEDEEYNGEDYGIDSLYHAQRILEKTLGKVDGYQSDDGILEHKCAITAIKKLYEQKPAWSEEDEKILDEIILDLKVLKYRETGETAKKEYQREINWLKDRYTWRPSDRQMKALNAINVTGSISYAGQEQELINLYNDLKKLK